MVAAALASLYLPSLRLAAAVLRSVLLLIAELSFLSSSGNLSYADIRTGPQQCAPQHDNLTEEKRRPCCCSDWPRHLQHQADFSPAGKLWSRQAYTAELEKWGLSDAHEVNVSHQHHYASLVVAWQHPPTKWVCNCILFPSEYIVLTTIF